MQFVGIMLRGWPWPVDADGSAGVGGSAAAGASAGSNQAGQSSGEAGTASSAGACPTLAPAHDGHGSGALVIPRADTLLGISARCDGSFVVVGSGSEVKLQGRAGTTLTSATIPAAAPGDDPARLKYWIAGFDTEGLATWVSAYWSGRDDGSGSDSRPSLFPDGSVLVGGSYSNGGAKATHRAGRRLGLGSRCAG